MVIFIKTTLRETKWLVCQTFNPPSQNDDYWFYKLKKLVGLYSSVCHNGILIDDFNAEESELCLTLLRMEIGAKGAPTCFPFSLNQN